MRILKRAATYIQVVCILAPSANALPNHSPSITQSGQHTGATHTPDVVSKPEFLVLAEKRLVTAQAALQADQKALDQLRQEESKLRQAAIARSGSWIEPTDLWKKKESLKQSIETKQRGVYNAERLLKRAENQFRSTSEGNWSKKHQPSWFGSWWQW